MLTSEEMMDALDEILNSEASVDSKCESLCELMASTESDKDRDKADKYMDFLNSINSNELHLDPTFTCLCINEVFNTCNAIIAFLYTDELGESYRHFFKLAGENLKHVRELVGTSHDLTSAAAIKLAKQLTESLYATTKNYSYYNIPERDRNVPYHKELTIAREWHNRKKPLLGKGSIKKFNAAAAIPCPENIDFLKKRADTVVFLKSAKERLSEAIVKNEDSLSHLKYTDEYEYSIPYANDAYGARVKILKMLYEIIEKYGEQFALCFDNGIIQRFVDGYFSQNDIDALCIFCETIEKHAASFTETFATMQRETRKATDPSTDELTAPSSTDSIS
jgi:hypothetical protein